MIKNDMAVAAEMFAAGVCNLDCAYCYIPKVNKMKDVHKKILEKLDSGKYVEELYELYGTKLENLSLWGTEPTLTLGKIQKNVPALYEKFPRLNSISWSSNFMLPPTQTIEFVKSIPKDRVMKLDIQCSLDGPTEITDVNRKEGATEVIVKNYLDMVDQLEKLELGKVTIRLTSKPTWDIGNVKYYLENPEKLHEYYEFFKVLTDTTQKAAQRNKNITNHFGSAWSMVCPGKYTSEEGKLYAKVVDMLYEYEDSHGIQGLNLYEYRISHIFDYQSEVANKAFMFTCSGGRSLFSVDETGALHICHRSLFLNNAEYVDDVMNLSGIEKWGVSQFDRASVELTAKKFVVADPNNEEDLARFMYVMGGYHNFLKLKVGYGVSLLYEMARAGQVLPIYQTYDAAFLLSLIVCTASSCPMENVLNTGIVHFTPASLFRLHGNGAFEKSLNRALLRRRGK